MLVPRAPGRIASLAEELEAEGHRTGHFGKNHPGDRNEHLSTVHGFDEFFGNLYRLNAQEESFDMSNVVEAFIEKGRQ